MPAHVPIIEGKSEESISFERDIAFLRGRGCHCTLAWDGTSARPFTTCDVTQKHGICPKRLDEQPANVGA